MSYFEEAHDQIRYVLGTDGEPGLRKSQVGAIHAISSHFTLQERAAVVVLPTGAGKTAVLMLTPYVLRARRALIITPSRFVRDQITRDVKQLRTLKLARALPEGLPSPSVFENKNTIRLAEEWESLRDYDIVISTPNGASPAYKTVPSPPEDLFDLVLVDEAHHTPAPTWNALIKAFPGSRCVLFTATPFRRDAKEITGKYIYTYPIQRAFDDGIYGEMCYIPVQPDPGANADEVLASEVERVFRADEANGFSHVLMVRADSRPRANQLAEIYGRHTSLRLEVVHSGKSVKTTDKVVERLRKGELDGVISVNMLGEGFDLPRLKIAALHSPHHSLAVTLQFFGRFARVNADRLGDAKVLAVESEIDEELSELFRESEAWGKKIRAIGQARIGREEFTREFLDEFQVETELSEEGLLEDLSLYTFNLFNHVKVYQVHGQVDLTADPALIGFITEKVWFNGPRASVVFLVREELRPDWSSTKGLDRVEHHLFVVYFDENAQLLFICATHREESVYKDVAHSFVAGPVRPLSLSKINRVLRRFADLELFNVGMRNRATGTVAESYRQLAGAAVHDAIEKSDGALYHRGHIFGRGTTPDGVATIGLSSLSKAWRLERTKIPQLVNWCHSLAREIENPAPFSTGIPLDHLDAGRDITELPVGVVLAADWQDHVYLKPPSVRCSIGAGNRTTHLLDFDLIVNQSLTGTDNIVVSVSNEQAATQLKCSVSPFPAVCYLDDDQPRWQVERGFRRVDFADYLTDNPLRFHFADGSLLEGCQLFEAPQDDAPYDSELLMRPVYWGPANVDIQREYGACNPPLRSIQDWLREDLVKGEAIVVFYDHRKGECADYVTVHEDADGNPAVKLFHCKGAGGPVAGDRVDDLYEVCGQAIKSVQWRSKKRLVRKVKERFRTGSVFCKGNMEAFLALVDPYPRFEFQLQINIVQPGVSKNHLSPQLATLLATASRGIVSVGCDRLRVICSH